jgi:hypothetical protein
MGARRRPDGNRRLVPGTPPGIWRAGCTLILYDRTSSPDGLDKRAEILER